MALARVVLVGFVLVGAPAYADEPVALDADAWCVAHPGEVLVRDVDNHWYRIAENLPRTDDEGRMSQAWTGNLDGDRRADLVLVHAAGCGTKECMYEAFVACRDGTYSSVMAPEYGDSVRVAKDGKRGWQRIELRHVGEAKDPRARYTWSTHRLTADGYR